MGRCLTAPQLFPISVSFTRDQDIAYHVAIQWPNSCIIPEKNAFGYPLTVHKGFIFSG